MTARLHVVLDPARWSHPARTAREVAAAGADAIHLRIPGGSGAEFLRMGSALLSAIEGRSCGLVINDRIDIAMALGVNAVQLPQRSFSPPHVRRLLGPGAQVGVSRHDVDGVRTTAGVDWFFAGHVFETRSHPGREPLGLAGLKKMVSAAGPVSVIAIGGIVEARVSSVLEAGASGVALFGAAFEAGPPAKAVEGVRRALDARRTLPCGS